MPDDEDDGQGEGGDGQCALLTEGLEAVVQHVIGLLLLDELLERGHVGQHGDGRGLQEVDELDER